MISIRPWNYACSNLNVTASQYIKNLCKFLWVCTRWRNPCSELHRLNTRGQECTTVVLMVSLAISSSTHIFWIFVILIKNIVHNEINVDNLGQMFDAQTNNHLTDIYIHLKINPFFIYCVCAVLQHPLKNHQNTSILQDIEQKGILLNWTEPSTMQMKVCWCVFLFL